jgi:lipopolysaccharide export system protein LptA
MPPAKRSLAALGMTAVLGMTTIGAAVAAPAKTKSLAEREKAAITQGPIKISAERAELEQREVALYQGNVKLTSNELTLTGERLELRQPARGQFQARLTGKPARIVHAAAGELPPMAATASEINYDTKAAQVDLTGGVQLERGRDTLSSDSLHYDVAARRISASGVGKGQVQITIQPGSINAPGLVPQEKGSQEKKAPAGQNPPVKNDSPPKAP